MGKTRIKLDMEAGQTKVEIEGATEVLMVMLSSLFVSHDDVYQLFKSSVYWYEKNKDNLLKAFKNGQAENN